MTGNAFDKTAEICVLSLLVLTPLALGSVYEWSYRLIAATTFLMLAVRLFIAVRKKGLSYVRTPVHYLLPATFAFVLFQVIPLPVRLVHIISPGRAALDTAAGFSGSYESLSLYPGAALDKGLFVFSMLVLFLLVLNVRWTLDGAKRAGYVVIGMGVLFAAAAILRISDRTLDHHFLPYVNNNHFAGYMEVAISLAAAYVVFKVSGADREKRVKGLYRKFNRGDWLTSSLWLILSLAVMFGALLLSMSRGGLFGLFASLLLIAALGYGRGKRTAVIFALLVLIVVTGLAVMGTGKFSARFGRLADVAEDKSAMMRLNIWKDTAQMVKASPVAGVGLGGYETAFPFYKSFSKYTIIFQPESDYLYVLSEGGAAGALLAAMFLALLAAGLFRAFKVTKGSPEAAVTAGALAALTALAVHGFVDTNLHIPANACLVIVLSGVGMSLGATRNPEGRAASGGTARLSLSGPYRKGAAYVLFILSLTAAGYAVSLAVADLIFLPAMQQKKQLAASTVDDPHYYAQGYEAVIASMERAGRLDPGRIDYPFEKAMAYNALGGLAEKIGSEKADDVGMLTSSEYYDMAYKGFHDAGQVNHYNSFAHALAGRALEDGLGDRARGEAEYLAAERLNPTNRLIKQVLIGFYKKTGDDVEARRREVELADYDPVNNKITIVSLYPDTPGNSAVVGDRVLWSADAKVISGVLEYKFCLRNVGKGELECMTGYTSAETWVWDTASYEPGRYRVVVRVRGAGGKATERSKAYKGGFVLRKK